MKNIVIEAHYPIQFHHNEAINLGNFIKKRENIMLIGMKRVGISNFLRFFLFHKDIIPTYIESNNKYLFIPVDLNDLVENEIFPFWILVLKRIVDITGAANISRKIQKHIEVLFLESIQTKDLFFVKESVRKSILLLVEEGFLPTVFFIRFDRIKDAITTEFFSNLQALQDATHNKLSYVFTSSRSLYFLSPQVFQKAILSTFCQDMYISPAVKRDIEIIYQTFSEKYKIQISDELKQLLFSFTNGYVQYVQLALILLEEQKTYPKKKEEFFELLVLDERINLQSEELWESLSSEEQELVAKVAKGQPMLQEENRHAQYLYDTGLLIYNENTIELFSPLFLYFVKQREKIYQAESTIIEMSKKENMLFQLLKNNFNEICEREKIIETIWAEQETIGVSDWAIDRLISRLRQKLKLQNSVYEIQTIRTRGHKLIVK